MNRQQLYKLVTGAIVGLLLVVTLAGAPTSWAGPKDTPITVEGKGYEVAFEQTGATMNLNFTLGDYSITKLVADGQTFSKLNFAGTVYTTDKGYAELPFIHAAVQLPPDRNVSLAVTGSKFVDYKLKTPLLPSKGTIYRDQDPNTIPYQVAPESIVNAWYPKQLADMIEPYIFRDVRGTNVYVYPFQYNAKAQVLRVYTDISVKLVENNSPAVNPLTRATKVVAEMEPVYRSMFVNYTPNTLNWANELAEFGHILVLYTSRDATVIQPYITWKREMGYTVQTQQVATGTNVKTTILNAYNANTNILYVQLVGDWADIKSDTTARAPMDPMLGRVVGTDYYPDLIIGRFSASTTTHVTTQINKAINYEKATSGTWYDKAMGIGSDEGDGIGDDGEIDWYHQQVIRDYRLIPYGYPSTGFTLLKGTSTASQVTTAVNAGLGLINYTGHGSTTSWGTTGFNNTNVLALTNGNMLPAIISVACVNGAFHSTTTDCFAEAWLRHTGGGAVATLMSTINQPWTPPMRGQDYMNDMIVGGYSYTANPGNGIDTTYGKKTFGAITFNGMVLMYTESSTSSDLDTLKTWTIFGDASLLLRTKAPTAIALSNSTVTTGVAFTTRVTAGTTGVANARVTISQGANIATGLTDANGYVTLNHSLTAGAAKLAVTGQNLATIYQNITVQ